MESNYFTLSHVAIVYLLFVLAIGIFADYSVGILRCDIYFDIH